MFSCDDLDIYFKICQISGIHSKDDRKVGNIFLMKVEDEQMQSFVCNFNLSQSSEDTALDKFSLNPQRMSNIKGSFYTGYLCLAHDITLKGI